MFITKTQKKTIESIGMKSLNKLLLIILSILSLIMITTACTAKESKNADILVQYQVPFAEPNAKWNEIALIEKDAYNRELYSYKSVGVHTNVFSDFMDDSFTNAPVIVYLIIQKADSSYVYAYNNLCYAYISSLEDDNSAIIEALKEQNDWGEPICDDKLTAFKTDFDSNGISGHISESSKSKAMEALEDQIGRKIEAYYFDCIYSQDAKEVYVLREVKQWPTQTEKAAFGESYVFIVSEDYSKATYKQLPSDVGMWNEQINMFFEENISK